MYASGQRPRYSDGDAQDDGGDIEYVSFDEDSGVVTVKLQGACSTCSSSKVTLKSGVENMLMHYVPEVRSHKPCTSAM